VAAAVRLRQTVIKGAVAIRHSTHRIFGPTPRRCAASSRRTASVSGSMYLLDTNVISELRRPRPHGAVVAWLESVADSDLYLSAVTLGEIQAGIELTRDQDTSKANEIDKWADLVSASYNVLPMDAKIFRVWARLMHRRSDTLYEDAMIAATAKVHELTVVTRNVCDFSHFEVDLFNPFEQDSAIRS
jgi:predicted nucleic acid-binding protein